MIALYYTTNQYINTQTSTGLKSKLSELQLIDQKQGRQKLIELLKNQTISKSNNRRYLLLATNKRRKIVGDLNAWPSSLVADNVVRSIEIEDNLIPNTVDDKDGFWPIVATTLEDGSLLLVAQDSSETEDFQEFILNTMGVILFAIVFLTLLLGWRLGRQVLQRVDTINRTAHQIRQGDLSIRIPTSRSNDEFDEVAAHLNRMLDHIEQLVKGMQEVTDNVAHDLRSPLSRLKTRIEVTLIEARDRKDYQHTLEKAVEDIDSMIKIFNALLEIAQAEAGSYRGEWTVLNLSQLSQDIGDLYIGVAEQNRQQLRINITPDINIKGNQYLLGQAISNLLENALKYSGCGKTVTLKLRLDNNYPVLCVEDNGAGIHSKDYHYVLQRFVRLDSARSTSGNGLGLSLVAAVARLHNASLKLEDTHPGLSVSISFKSTY